MKLITWREYCLLDINRQIEYDFWIHIIDSPKRYLDSPPNPFHPTNTYKPNKQDYSYLCMLDYHHPS